MSYELFLALRYLKGNRNTLGGGLTSAIAVGGVTVGVAALIVTLSVMTGFREDIRAKILAAQPHLMVMGSGGTLPAGNWGETLAGIPGVKAWSPYVMGQALIKRGTATQGVVVKGVDPDREKNVTDLPAHLKEGRWESLGEPAGTHPPPVLLGKELAKLLQATLGDQVLLTAPNASLAPLAGMPTLYNFTVTGILETGLYDYDSTLAVIPLPLAQIVFQTGKNVSGLGVRTDDADDSPAVAMRLQKGLGSSAWVRSWLSLNRNLFSALKLEKAVMFVILILITLVAAFTIVSNLLLVTAQKVREIGILNAMGARRGSIVKIFLWKGLLMGGLGAAGGISLGLLLSLLLKHYKFIHLPADVYYVETLPVKILPADLALVAGAAFLIVLAASYYPARLAAKLDALTAIRQT